MLSRQVIIILILAVIACLVVFCYTRKSSSENFTGMASGSINNIGSLSEPTYDLLDSPESCASTPHFADLVDQGDHTSLYMKDKQSDEDINPMERLHRVQGRDLLPRVSSQVTPFNIDVADPTSHKYMANAPRVTTIKSRFKDYSAASFIRGDIPITYNPNVPLVSKTVQGRDDLRLDGLFTPHFKSLYNKYTGKAYKNFVQDIAGAGQASGYGGASGGIIMDHN